MLIVLSSLTSAQRLKRILLSKKIPSEIIQTPKVISSGGCSYSLKIKSEDTDLILPLVKEAGINIKGIFEEEKIDNEVIYEEKSI